MLVAVLRRVLWFLARRVCPFRLHLNLTRDSMALGFFLFILWSLYSARWPFRNIFEGEKERKIPPHR